MLTHKINALRYMQGLLDIMQGDDEAPRFSLLDGIALLHINEHPGCSKSDLVEFFYGDRYASKSSLDRPVARLERYGFIEASWNNEAKVKSGESRTSYKLTDKAEEFLASCSKGGR